MKKLGLALSVCMMMFVQVGCAENEEKAPETPGGPPAAATESGGAEGHGASGHGADAGEETPAAGEETPAAGEETPAAGEETPAAE